MARFPVVLIPCALMRLPKVHVTGIAVTVLLWAGLCTKAAAESPAGSDAHDASGQRRAQQSNAPSADTGPQNHRVAPATAPAVTGDAVESAIGQPLVKELRAVSVVSADDIAQRAPRTTSQALAPAPGVFVPGSHHAAGTPVVRGRQPAIVIDGFRLDTSVAGVLALDAIDPALLQRIEILRGPGSVVHGSDASGGVINLVLRPPAGTHGQLRMRAGSADRSGYGRVEQLASIRKTRVRVGLSANHFGDLRGAGPLLGTPLPAYEGTVQTFTGYDQLALDARADMPVARGMLSAAVVNVRQFDAPLTPACSADPQNCRYFDNVSHDLAYLRYRGALVGLADLDLGVGFVRTFVARSHVSPAATDDVQVRREHDEAYALTARALARLPVRNLGDSSRLQVSGGVESRFHDILGSQAWTELMSSGARVDEARGALLQDATYWSGAAFGLVELDVDEHLSMTAGLRFSAARAAVPGDPESRAPGFSHNFFLPVAQGGVRVRLIRGLHLVGHVGQGFRAPDLSDLTGRRALGPGFQLANPDLDPETAITFEAGLTWHRPRLDASVFAYQRYIDGFITADLTVCPTDLRDMCGDAAQVFRLVNAARGRTRGLELAARARLTPGAMLVANLTWTEADRVLTDGSTQPASMIPPLNGVVGLRLGTPRYYFEFVQRISLAQKRLSPADMADPRIPDGGTPGYGIIDFRLGANWNNGVRASFTVHNALDVRYRVHGSGLDGPGLGALAALLVPFAGF